MSEITIDSKELREFAKEISRLPQKIKRPIRQSLFQGASVIKADAADKAPSGVSPRGSKLKPNITVFPKAWNEMEIGPREAVKHAAAAEDGSKPHFPPVEALTEREEPLDRWVRLKLGITKKARIGVALSIARKISRSGTKAQPYMQPAFSENLDKVVNYITTSIDRILKSL